MAVLTRVVRSSLAPDLDGDGVVSEEEVFEFMKFDPETVKTWEFGWKTTALQGRMTSKLGGVFLQIHRCAGSGFHWSMTPPVTASTTPLSVLHPMPVRQISMVLNGKVRRSWQMTSGVTAVNCRFGWAVGYIDADYKEYIDAFGNDVADERVFQNTPKWTATGTFTYEMPVNLFNTPGLFSVITAIVVS